MHSWPSVRSGFRKRVLTEFFCLKLYFESGAWGWGWTGAGRLGLGCGAGARAGAEAGTGDALKRKLVYLKMERLCSNRKKRASGWPTATSNLYLFLC